MGVWGFEVDSCLDAALGVLENWIFLAWRGGFVHLVRCLRKWESEGVFVYRDKYNYLIFNDFVADLRLRFPERYKKLVQKGGTGKQLEKAAKRELEKTEKTTKKTTKETSPASEDDPHVVEDASEFRTALGSHAAAIPPQLPFVMPEVPQQHRSL